MAGVLIGLGILVFFALMGLVWHWFENLPGKVHNALGLLLLAGAAIGGIALAIYAITIGNDLLGLLGVLLAALFGVILFFALTS